MAGAAGGIAWLREAAWLGRRRAIAYSKIVVLAFAVIASGWIAAGDGLIDPEGKPVGTDFVSFWAASSLALHGAPEAAYDPAQHRAAEQQAVGRAEIPYYAWFYPPLFLLIAAPLALLPYGWSLALWLTATGAGYAAVMRRMLPTRGALWAAFGFPGALVNIMHGQNAFLSASLLGGGIVLLDRNPVLAGMLLGALAYKPQLFCLVPLALLAGGCWTALAATLAGAALLAAASIALFGRATLATFLASTDLARRTLEDGLVDWDKMQSLFAGMRLLGAPIEAAYAAQAVMALAGAAAVIAAWHSRAGTPAKGAVLATATLLVSPFMLDYDFVLLAIPMASVACDGARTGFASWEKASVALAWLLPLIARPIAGFSHVGITPAACALVLAVVLRRARRETGRCGLDAVAHTEQSMVS